MWRPKVTYKSDVQKLDCKKIWHFLIKILKNVLVRKAHYNYNKKCLLVLFILVWLQVLLWKSFLSIWFYLEAWIFVIFCLETSFSKCTCQSTVKINCANTIQEFHHVFMMQLINITIQFCHPIGFCLGIF